MDTFLNKLDHAYEYHPEIFVKAMPRLAEFSKAAGEYLGEQLKGAIHGIKTVKS